MARYGEVISKHRKLNNLTQASLAEKLFVSPQAISKWEKNQSEPDLTTIKKLAEIFNISLNDFFEEEKETTILIESETIEQDHSQISCGYCGELERQDCIIYIGSDPICQSCQAKLKKEEDFFNNLNEIDTKKKLHKFKRRFTPFWIGIIIGIASLTIFIASFFAEDAVNRIPFNEYLIISTVLSIFITTFSTQMLYETKLREFVSEFVGRSITLPGFIFELSIDGIILLILVKILAGVLSVLISLTILMIGIVVAGMISPISYLIELIKKLKEVNNHGI